MRSSIVANPNQAHTSSVPMMATVTNPTAPAYSGIPNQNNNSNNMHSTIPMTRLPQHHQYQPPSLPQQQQQQQQQQGRIVSPVVSPILPREQIIVHQNSPSRIPNQLGNSPMKMNQNAMGWQRHTQLQQQINPARSCDSEEIETGSDVSSIHMGSIRPDPNYDPAKDPISPENFDKPFVPPLEITIRVVKGRRRKTLGSHHSSATHTTHSTMSTAASTRYSVEEDKLHHHQVPPTTTSEWLHTPKHLTTQSGSIPELGLINSFTSEATDSNSFSGSGDFQSAEELMYLEEDLLELQEGQNNNNNNAEETKQRKGMVRREFNRRLMRFKKHKKKNKNSASNNNNNTSNEFSGDEDDDDDESGASGNKIIIKLKIDDDNKNNNKNKNTISNNNINNINIPEPLPKHNFQLKSKNLYPTTFGGRLKHRRSNSMQMIVGQENGC